jgi:hypothetical protein
MSAAGANLGRHERPGVDARGWLWAITRGDQAAQVVIEISGTAWSSHPLHLPEDTRHALETTVVPSYSRSLTRTTHRVSFNAALAAALIFLPRMYADRLKTISRR